MASYFPLVPSFFAPSFVSPSSSSSDSRYYSSFSSSVLTHSSKVSHIAFSPIDIHDIAVATGTRVVIYDGLSLSARRSLSRFESPAYCPAYRNDGKMLGAGAESGLIQLFDIESRTILRSLKGHSAAVRSVCFGALCGRFFSGSDDRSVRVWDVPSERCITNYTNWHSDYVRSVAQWPGNENIFISSSYDGSVRFLDTRLAGPEAAVKIFQHGAPIEAFTSLPGNGLLASAGENFINVFDVGQGAVVQRLSNHQKTITAICVAPAEDARQHRLVSTGLDQMVKFYDLHSFQVVHSLKVDQPALAVAAAPDGRRLAVGLANGALDIRTRPESKEQTVTDSKPPVPSSHRYFNRGQSYTATEDDFTVEHLRKARLSAFDHQLKQFNYHAALDSALHSNQPTVIACLLDELIERSALTLAIKGRDDSALEPLLRFLIHYLPHPSYGSLLIDVANCVLDVYGASAGQSILFDELLQKLTDKVREEIALQHSLLMLQGATRALATQAAILANNKNEEKNNTITPTAVNGVARPRDDPQGKQKKGKKQKQ